MKKLEENILQEIFTVLGGNDKNPELAKRIVELVEKPNSEGKHIVLESRVSDIIKETALMLSKSDSPVVENAGKNILTLLSQTTKAKFMAYDDGLAGDVAKKYRTVVGEIGCPHCGMTHHGALYINQCDWCDKPYFETENEKQEKEI